MKTTQAGTKFISNEAKLNKKQTPRINEAILEEN